MTESESMGSGGYLEEVENPAHEKYVLEHDQGGLLVSRTDPRGSTSTYRYTRGKEGETDGQLMLAMQPELDEVGSGYKAFERTGDTLGYEVAMMSTTKIFSG